MKEGSLNWFSLRQLGIISIVVLSTFAFVGCVHDENESSFKAPTLNATGGLKQVQFSWNNIVGASYYNLLENPDGSSGFSAIASNISGVSYNHQLAVHLTDWMNASYIIEACDTSGCVSSSAIGISSLMINTIGYIKASNTEGLDLLTASVALSADGNTLAVGTYKEASAATGINGDQTDNSAPNAGAVYIYSRTGNSWTQQAYIKASNTDRGDNFGRSVALSVDGNTLAVGAHWEASAATGINGDQTDNSAPNAGAVYVYNRTGTTWQQQAYIKASNTDGGSSTTSGDTFGGSVDLSADGNTLVVGAENEASAATGINGDQADNTLPAAGAVYVYNRTGTTWQQQAYVKASNTGTDEFGRSVAISASGNTLAVGAVRESSAATGINGDQSDNTVDGAGAVYVYNRVGTSWQQQAYVKASNTDGLDYFGSSIALNADGNTLAVGTDWEDSAASGVDGDQMDNTAPEAGAVYVYSRTGAIWQQQAYVKASNTEGGDAFGFRVTLSADGNTLVVGAPIEASLATGVDGDQMDSAGGGAGAVYVYNRAGTVWQQQSYVKASNTDPGDQFGISVSLAADGNTLAVGAIGEGSSATGIGGDQSDNSMGLSGAVYLY